MNKLITLSILVCASLNVHSLTRLEELIARQNATMEEYNRRTNPPPATASASIEDPNLVVEHHETSVREEQDHDTSVDMAQEHEISVQEEEEHDTLVAEKEDHNISAKEKGKTNASEVGTTVHETLEMKAQRLCPNVAPEALEIAITGIRNMKLKKIAEGSSRRTGKDNGSDTDFAESEHSEYTAQQIFRPQI